MGGTGGANRLVLVLAGCFPNSWSIGMVVMTSPIVGAVGWWTGPDRTLFAGDMYRTRGFGTGEG